MCWEVLFLKDRRFFQFWYVLIPAGILAFSWFFPQILFRDCVRPVCSQEPRSEAEADLTEEDYIQLFSPQKDEYRICWKFLPIH